MRVALLLLLAIPAAADPKPRVTWADWAGDWSGALAWKSCAVDGNASATLALDAIDGALRIDLAPAGDRVEAVSLVEQDDTMIAQTADVSLALQLDRGKLAPRRARDRLHADGEPRARELGLPAARRVGAHREQVHRSSSAPPARGQASAS